MNRLSLSVLSLVACQAPQPVESPPPPASVAATVLPLLPSSGAVFLELSFDGKPPLVLRYDTGSPATIVSPSALSSRGLKSGMHQVSIGGHDLGVHKVGAYASADDGQPLPGLPSPVVGLLGTDFFGTSSVGLNFRDNELWLTAPLAPDAAVPHPVDVGEPVVIAIRQVKGALVVPCSFDDVPADRSCLYDTGSPDALSTGKYWSTVSHPDARTVPAISADFEGTALTGWYQRARAIHFGDLVEPGARVIIFDKFAVFDDSNRLLKIDCVGLIGLDNTRNHFTVIDYANDRMLLYPYPTAPAPETLFHGYGFVLNQNDSGDLYADQMVVGSSAEKAGIIAGDVIDKIDGVSWDEAVFDVTEAGIIGDSPGTERTFTFRRDHQPFEVKIVAEDLLPPLM